jgi:hypothetical protein
MVSDLLPNNNIIYRLLPAGLRSENIILSFLVSFELPVVLKVTTPYIPLNPRNWCSPQQQPHSRF